MQGNFSLIYYPPQLPVRCFKSICHLLLLVLNPEACEVAFLELGLTATNSGPEAASQKADVSAACKAQPLKDVSLVYMLGWC